MDTVDEVAEEFQKGDDVSSVVSGEGGKSDTMYDSTGNGGVSYSLQSFVHRYFSK